MKCLRCGHGGEWFCVDCEADYARIRGEVANMCKWIEDDPKAGHLTLCASAILEAYERVENTTALGKTAITARAFELLAEVEDQYTYSPMCVLCGRHKMELTPGEPITVSCTGGCQYD